MTPKELDEIVRGLGGEYGDTTSGQDTLVAEIRRLWAERDARAIVGGPVSEERLADIRETVSSANMWPTVTTGLLRELIAHIAFLERILADADDFPRARRTGYADGWRAGLNAWAELMRHHGTKAGLKTWGDLIKAASELAEEGPP
jgi:hypothetical protein